MEDKLPAFEIEMEKISKMINKTLASHPELSGFQLDMLTIKPMEDQKLEGGNQDAVKDLHKIEKKHSVFHYCRICYDREGNKYCYYGTRKECPE